MLLAFTIAFALVPSFLLLGYFRARAIPGVEHVTDAAYRRTVVVDGDPGVLELTRAGTDQLMLRAHLPHWEGLIHIVQRARRIFSLDAPIDGASDHLSHDPIIGPLIRARPGLRVPGSWDPFETAVRAIVGQQVSVAGASTITGRLVRRHGKRVPGLDALGLTHTFPPPHVLANTDLTNLGLPGARAAAIGQFADAVARGDVPLDRSAPLDRLVDAITAIPGLGPWTAHYIALRLGERDAFPADDLGLRRAVKNLMPEATPSLDELAVHWSPWSATAATHLWHAQGEPRHQGSRNRLAAHELHADRGQLPLPALVEP